MKTAYDLLMAAPEDQITRAQIAFKAIAAGRWLDAAHSLRNAANEEAGQWATEARKLAAHCERMAA